MKYGMKKDTSPSSATTQQEMDGSLPTEKAFISIGKKLLTMALPDIMMTAETRLG